jgi:hypothetical protein
MSNDTKTATADKTQDRNQRRKQKAITVLAWIFVGLGFLAAIYGLWVTARTPEGFTLPNLSHIIKFVDTSHVLAADSERKRYTSLVRAQLSGTELFLIFYNGLCPHAAKFRPLIEKYGLLEHLDKSLLLHEAHAQFYERAYD